MIPIVQNINRTELYRICIESTVVFYCFWHIVYSSLKLYGMNEFSIYAGIVPELFNSEHRLNQIT